MDIKNVIKKKIKSLSEALTLSLNQLSIYDKWIVLICAAILVAVPLVVSTISNDQSEIVKLAVLRFLVTGIVFVWAVKNWRKSEPVVFSWREGLLVSFLILLVLSTLQSIDTPTSLLGTYRRYEGLLTFITYITLYFVAMQVFKNKSQLRLMIEITSIVGGIVAFYGILQYVGWDPIFESEKQTRSFSTFGNADLLAGYLVLAFPCAIGAYLNNGNKRRFLHGFMVLLIIACLYTSFARGGWIGAFFALSCLAVLLGRKVLKNRLREIAILSTPLIIIIITLLIYSSSQPDYSPNRRKIIKPMSRLTSMFNYKKGTALVRVLIWKSGLRMIKDKPLLGQGPGTYRLAAEHFQTKQEVRLNNGGNVADNAHNYFIQLAAEAGLLAAVLIYAFFIAWIIKYIGIRRGLDDKEEEGDRILISAVVAAVVGYLVVMIFGISVVGEAAVFWLLLASVAGYTYQAKPVNKTWQISKWTQGLKIGLTISLVILATVNAGIAAAMYAGDIYFYEGLKASFTQPELASVNFDKAASLYPVNGLIMLKKGQMYQRLARWGINAKDQEYGLYSLEANEAYESAVQAEPLEVDYQIFLASAYGDIGRIDDAKKILDIALWRSPYSPSAHRIYGMLEQAQGYNKEALKHYEEAIDLTPTEAFPDIYLRMADLYKEAGNNKKAAIFEAAGRLKKPIGSKIIYYNR